MPRVPRHAFVSQLIALGYDAAAISAMAAHSPNVLLLIYAHACGAARAREGWTRSPEARKAIRAALSAQLRRTGVLPRCAPAGRVPVVAAAHPAPM